MAGREQCTRQRRQVVGGHAAILSGTSAGRRAGSLILARMKPDLTERLLRGLYSLALYALLPVTIYHLVWRGFRHPAYLSRWNERYARYGDAPACQPGDEDTLWVHAVSVGEVAWLRALMSMTFDALMAEQIDPHTAAFLLGLSHVWAATHTDQRLRAMEFMLGR